MRRYLSDRHMDDEELFKEKVSIKSIKRKIPQKPSRVNQKEHKSKEDAFDDWADSINQDILSDPLSNKDDLEPQG